MTMKNVLNSDQDALTPMGQHGYGRVSTPKLGNANINGQAMLAATAVKKSRRITIVKG